MQLRDYQQAAVQAVYDHLQRRNDNPVVVCPTGAGKSLLIAKIASDAVKLWQGRVLVLAHVKELLEQNADKIRKLCPDLPVGVYSAGLKRRDTDTPVLVAGIQSIYKRACELEPFDLILVDEAHMIGNGDGMYRQFLSESKVINPLVRVIGLTATPFRLDSGLICTPDHFLNHICYEIGVRELIRDGYLCPLISKAGVHRADYSSVHVRGGEFVVDEVESLANEPNLVAAACQEIVQYTQDRRAVLIFATSVAHGRQVVRTFQEQHGIDCGFVSGLTPADERAELLARFRGDRTSLFSAEPLKYLCNVNVLTTGFDAPRTDCIVMLRPTMSPGLLVQCVGRGFRLHPDKQNCLILDFGGNIERHGPIDQVQPKERKPTDSFSMPVQNMKVEMWTLDRIKPYDKNPRINDGAVDAVAKSIQSFGVRQPIVVDTEGVIIVGHTRWKAAKKLGLTEVPVHVARDMEPEAVRAYRIADNKTAEIAEWDFDLLPIELKELENVGYDLSMLGFDAEELAQLLDPGIRDGLTDPDDVPEPPDDAITQPGDLWILGNHRLLCGDSSKAEDVDRLLAGAPIHLCNTDPPYNVKVEPRSNNAIAAGLSSFAPDGAAKRLKQGQSNAASFGVDHETG